MSPQPLRYRGVVTRVYVCMPVCRLRDRGQEIARLILEKNGYVFICGDGNHMAKDVNRVLLEVLSEFGDMTIERAAEVLAEMKLRRRYLLDIWS